MAAGRPLLVLVTGPPASGKTTIARELARRLEIPAFHKDDFKECLGDEIPGSTLEWSQRLGAASYRALYHVGQSLLEAGLSVLLEANFHPELSLPDLRAFASDADVAQVVCRADPDVLMYRYRNRYTSHGRHHVHLSADAHGAGYLEAAFRRDHRLDLAGLTLACDTTGAELVDAGALANEIRQWADSRRADVATS